MKIEVDSAALHGLFFLFALCVIVFVVALLPPAPKTKTCTEQCGDQTTIIKIKQNDKVSTHLGNTTRTAQFYGVRPTCLRWHRVQKGETQWRLANRVAHKHPDKWQWIRSMRWISYKSVGDEDLKAGESVCVDWV